MERLKDWNTESAPLDSPETEAPSRHEIEILAHQIWMQRGCQSGTAESDWLEAERRLKMTQRRQEAREFAAAQHSD